jgi:hypothetical protein
MNRWLSYCEARVAESLLCLGYGLNDRGSIPSRGRDSFLFATASRSSLGSTQPTVCLVPGALSVGVKRPGREADHLPPSSAEVKNALSYTSTLQYVFMTWCLVKAQCYVPDGK